MSTTATLEQSILRLDPGTETVVPLQVSNNGDIVEGYRLEVLGAAAAWSTVEPEVISLYPGTTTTAAVSFRPPRTAGVPAGELKFGVLVTPTEHPDEAVAPEGVIDVLAFYSTTAEILPRTSRGRRGARHRLAVDNRGNVALTAAISAADQQDQLRFRLQAPELTVGPGQAEFADLKVKPKTRLWRGVSVTHPFAVAITPQGAPPVTLDGTHVHEPLLPSWLGKAAFALLAVLVALAAVWFALLKPTIESAAREAVAEPVAQAKEQAEQAQEDAQHAQEDAQQAEEAAQSAGSNADRADEAAGKADKAAGRAREVADGPAPPRTVVTTLSRRLQVDTGEGRAGEATFTVPARQTVELADFVMSNPQGDFGRVQVALDDQILFDMALENFRDIDYHFVTPIRATAGQELTMTVQCNRVGSPPGQTPPPDTCNTAMYFGGEVTSPAPAPAAAERPNQASTPNPASTSRPAPTSTPAPASVP